jgi:CRISPR-associated protein Cas1
MIKRTVEISSAAAHLSVRRKQLVIQRDRKTVGQIPCEDIGVVLVDHPNVSYTHAALSELAACGAVVVICGANHLPAALVQPLSDHCQIVWRLHEQLSAKAPVRKQLWKQLVQAKIRGQANNLPDDCSARSKLVDLARNVRSGDPTNVEAQAARVYWQHLFGDIEFRRDRDAIGLNSFLNYGYAVVRAALGRAIVAAGLMPALGLHHANRGNSFCLADDLIEPLRPLVDRKVREMHDVGYVGLDQTAKAALLELLTDPVQFNGDTGPLMVSLHRMTASLVKCLRGDDKKLEIPLPCS